MKRITYTFLICLLAMGLATQSMAQLSRVEQRDIRRLARDLENDGWEMVGPYGMEMGITKTRERLATGTYLAITGTKSNGCASDNLCKQACLTDAATKLAQELSSFMTGTVKQLNVSDNLKAAMSTDKTTSAFETQVQMDMSGVMSSGMGYTIRKKDGSAYEIVYLHPRADIIAKMQEVFKNKVAQQNNLSPQDLKEFNKLMEEALKSVNPNLGNNPNLQGKP